MCKKSQGDTFLPAERKTNNSKQSTLEKEAEKETEALAPGKPAAKFILVDAMNKMEYSYDEQGRLTKGKSSLRKGAYIDAGPVSDTLKTATGPVNIASETCGGGSAEAGKRNRKDLSPMSSLENRSGGPSTPCLCRAASLSTFDLSVPDSYMPIAGTAAAADAAAAAAIRESLAFDNQLTMDEFDPVEFDVLLERADEEGTGEPRSGDGGRRQAEGNRGTGVASMVVARIMGALCLAGVVINSGAPASHMKRVPAGSMPGRPLSIFHLEQKGLIDKSQKGVLEDLINSGDSELLAALDLYDNGDASQLEGEVELE
eukprot:g6858.t1